MRERERGRGEREREREGRERGGREEGGREREGEREREREVIQPHTLNVIVNVRRYSNFFGIRLEIYLALWGFIHFGQCFFHPISEK
jgi:hypothetical protein